MSDDEDVMEYMLALGVLERGETGHISYGQKAPWLLAFLLSIGTPLEKSAVPELCHEWFFGRPIPRRSGM